MVEARAADYIAAALAYAISIRRIQATSEETSFFVGLLKDEFGVAVPERAVRQALQILHDEALLISDGDRFKPTVRVPEDAHERVVRWRFSGLPTQAAQIHDRFSNGSWDWMATVLASPEFNHELEIESGSSVVLSDDFKTWETLRAKIAHPIRPDVQPSPQAPLEAPLAHESVKPAPSINWTKWGTILAALGIIVTIVIAILS